MKLFEIMQVRDQMQVMLQMEQKQLNEMLGDWLKKLLPNATAEEQTRFK